MIPADRLTVRAAEALNTAAELARKEGNPAVEDLHLLAALLEQDDGIIDPILRKVGASPSVVASGVRAGIERLPRQSGAAPAASREFLRILDEADSEARGLGDQYVSTEHSARRPVGQGGQFHECGPGECGGDPRLLARGTESGARTSPGHGPGGRREVSGARTVRHRSYRTGPARRTRPGDRQGSGDPQSDAGPVPADEEQPRAHRGTGCREDGDRGGAGSADRRGRRTGKPERQETDPTRHRGDARRGKVPRASSKSG